MLTHFLPSLRLAAVTILLCCVGYTSIVLASAAAVAPHRRHGDLVVVNGSVIGAHLVAQSFTRDEYLWPRPSAVNYAADAAGGSNLSPLNSAITDRAREIVARLEVSESRPAPADLVTASGSGLDPHISLDGALHQAPRIAHARNAALSDIEQLIRNQSEGPPGMPRIVNVLQTNIAFDHQFPAGGITTPSGQ